VYDFKNKGANSACNVVQEYILRNTYVWVKATYFADYIDYRDFNQSLNQTSDVVFKNTIIDPGVDFDRFDIDYTNVNGVPPITSKLLAELTRPYVPVSTPGYDLVSFNLGVTKANTDTP
jgi:hypothetical protein